MDLSSINLMQDLWAALWLIVESDGLNERQLSNANFPAFILGLARDRLQDSQTADRRPEQHIIILLLSLALPRRTPLLIVIYCQFIYRPPGTILGMSKEERDELYGLIYPFIFMPSRVRYFPSDRMSFNFSHWIPLLEVPITVFC
jgi:hypothetical protein